MTNTLFRQRDFFHGSMLAARLHMWCLWMRGWKSGVVDYRHDGVGWVKVHTTKVTHA